MFVTFNSFVHYLEAVQLSWKNVVNKPRTESALQRERERKFRTRGFRKYHNTKTVKGSHVLARDIHCTLCGHIILAWLFLVLFKTSPRLRASIGVTHSSLSRPFSCTLVLLMYVLLCNVYTHDFTVISTKRDLWSVPNLIVIADKAWQHNTLVMFPAMQVTCRSHAGHMTSHMTDR